ncbi:tetratricopeptide repeat protein [Silvibacterium sp.]|uniref:tetratricopeptide repeat protein n=1 Tax=Silvibacterium sp. TaxID=1964179 RepID=UPI0039E6AEEF
MTSKPRRPSLCRIASLALATFALGSAAFAQAPAQSGPASATPATPPAQNSADAGQQADRAQAYYHYMLAHEYEELAMTTGRSEYATRAGEEYKLALNNDPGSKFLNNGLAELYYRTGRIRDAISAAQDQIKKDPKNLEAHKLLGNIYLRTLSDGQQNSASDEILKLAIDEYNTIVQLEPNSVEDHLLLGQLYSFAHDSVHAEQQFDAAKKIDPSSEETALSLARLYAEQGDTKRAISILNQVPPEDRTAKTEFLLGATYEHDKDTKDAIAAYQRAVDLDPDSLDAERALAKLLLADNQLTPALKAFQDVAAGDPSDPEALLRISEIQRRQGHYEDALATLKKAKALAPDSIEISFQEGLLDDTLGRFDEAIAIFEKLTADSEHTSGQYSEPEKNNHALFLERLAIIYGEANQTEKAAATWQKLADLGTAFSDQAYESEVDAYRDGHEYDKATQVARDAVAKDPSNRARKLMLATQLADNGKADEGITLAKSLLSKQPSDLEVYRALATIYTRLRKWKDAAQAIDEAEQLSTKPDDKLYVHFLRGVLYERQKQFAPAEAEFRQVLVIDPKNSMTLNYLGYMLADHDMKLDEALSMIQKAVELDPQNYAYLDSLGWAYFKLGKYNQAEDDLRRAVSRNATDATVHDHLGELYEKTGRLKLAASQWEESLNDYSHTLPADIDPGDVDKVQKRLDNARVRLAREGYTPDNTAKQQ